jgi:hypothetical protein
MDKVSKKIDTTSNMLFVIKQKYLPAGKEKVSIILNYNVFFKFVLILITVRTIVKANTIFKLKKHAVQYCTYYFRA